MHAVHGAQEVAESARCTRRDPAEQTSDVARELQQGGVSEMRAESVECDHRGRVRRGGRVVHQVLLPGDESLGVGGGREDATEA